VYGDCSKEIRSLIVLGETMKAVENNPQGLRRIHSIDTSVHVSVSPTVGTNFSYFSS